MSYSYNIIVAMDERNAIGKHNDLPWDRIDRDMKRFISLTSNNTVVMGRKTFESIGKPLKNRINVILTKNKDFKYDDENIFIFNDIAEMEKQENLDLITKNGKKKIFIIGGSEIYRSFINKAENIYLTRVHHIFDGCDTYFDWEPGPFMWHELKSEKIEKEKSGEKYDFSFIHMIPYN